MQITPMKHLFFMKALFPKRVGNGRCEATSARKSTTMAKAGIVPWQGPRRGPT